MKHPLCLIVAACILCGAHLALADTEETSGSPYVIGAAIVGGSLAIVNIVAWAREGNNALGTTGVLVGFLQTGLGLAVDGETYGDVKGAFVAIGVLDIVTGFGAIKRASNHTRQARDIDTGWRIDPWLRSFDHQHWLGIGLSTSW